ncbi:MAG TPA: ribosomal protein L7/L12 [Phycisphaerae bacterium]|nr:ribosomal protein L7/L12 [Phycisphaerae bacterium]
MATFQVVVEGGGVKNVALIRALRGIGGMGLREAKEVVEWMAGRGEVVVVAGVGREAAERALVRLKEAGARGRVEGSGVETPMVVRPGVERGYRGGVLGMVGRKERSDSLNRRGGGASK